MAKIKKVKLPKDGFKIHPSAEVFPMMSRTELDELKTSIDRNGLEEPIAVIGDQIIDGRNRYKVLKELGRADSVYCYRDVSHRFLYQAEDTLTPIDYVIALNLHRRHLNEAQLASIGVEIKKRKAIEAKERQGRRSDIRGNIPDYSPECCVGDARDKAAESLGISGRSIDRAEKVLESDTAVPELKDAVREGEVAVSSAAAIVDLPPEEQRKAVAGGKKGVAEAAKKARAAKKEEPAEKDPVLDFAAAVGVRHAEQAIALLSRIPRKDVRRDEGLALVEAWIAEQRKNKETS